MEAPRGLRAQLAAILTRAAIVCLLTLQQKICIDHVGQSSTHGRVYRASTCVRVAVCLANAYPGEQDGNIGKEEHLQQENVVALDP